MTTILEDLATQTQVSPAQQLRTTMAGVRLSVILAAEGECYARLQFNVGPGVSQELAVGIDYSHAFAGTSQETWDEGYVAHVQSTQWPRPRWWDETLTARGDDDTPQAWRDAWHSYSDDEFQEMMAYE